MSEDLHDRLQAAVGNELELIRLVGRGGMAEVHLARDCALDRLVVIKVLPPDSADQSAHERFRREARLAAQLEHHPLADPRMEERFARYQIHNPEIDLSQPRQTAHAVNWYNLHVVLVQAERWREIRDEFLQKVHAMLLRSSAAKGHLLSRAAILTDHFHLMLGCQTDETPQEVILSYMNNLAYVWGMRPVFQFGGFVGTFGEYDLGAVQ